MFNGLVDAGSVNFLMVFLEGVLSFFSPCVIPLLPVYISYLAGGAKKTDGDIIHYDRGRVFFHTLCFVLGISLAFFVLGMSFSALGSFMNEHRTLFARIGGILIILLGLIQMGFLDFKFLQRERRWHLKMPRTVNPFFAFLMGFAFSFAWTPCVGPMLSSVLILASSAESALVGNLLVAVYALGFVVPFLILGLFTSQMLNFLQKRKNWIKYTIKIGGAVLIVMGIMTLTGWMNGITGYLNKPAAPSQTPIIAQTPTPNPSPSAPAALTTPESLETPAPTPEKVAAFDFTLTDQYGNSHTLSDCKGKVVFLNFWATWCGPCKMEMPHIESLYQDWGRNSGDVIVLAVAAPGVGQEKDREGIIDFLEENGYTFPVVFDETQEVFYDYAISSFPTTFMIDREGNIYGYAPGSLTRELMDRIIDQTMEAE